MHRAVLVSVILSFLASASEANGTNWKLQAEALITGEVDMARAHLLARPQLDEELRAGLKAGGESERLALAVIRLLPRPTLVNDLVDSLKSMDINSMHAKNYFVTLSSMARGENGDLVVRELNNKVDLTSPKISSALRISLLSAMTLRSSAPNFKTLTQLLFDPSYELRQKAMDVSSLAADRHGYEAFLHKALEISPYPVRLKAANAVAELPLSERRTFQTQIARCAASDQNEVVKKACGQITFK